MRERHRLRDLEVREAGQDRLDVRRGDFDQHALQLGEQCADRLDLVAQPEPDVGRDLIVARAPGVQALAGIAGELDQARLDVEVHVFEIDAPPEVSALDLLADGGEAALDGGKVGRRDHLRVGQHRRVRKAAGDVGAPEPLVERDAGRVTLHELAGRLGKERRPGFGFFLELVGGHEMRGLPERAKRAHPHGSLSPLAQHGPTAGRRLATIPSMCDVRIRAILSASSALTWRP